MKNIIVLFLCMITLLPVSYKANAQEKAKIKITTIREKGRLIHFTLISSKPFIFANNRYILHIGNKEIYRNEQTVNNGKGIMTFLIPEDDFNALQEDADIYLTYGKISTDGMDMDAMNKTDFEPFWSLGKFSKTLLTK